jgi:hypothetical protein
MPQTGDGGDGVVMAGRPLSVPRIDRRRRAAAGADRRLVQETFDELARDLDVGPIYDRLMRSTIRAIALVGVLAGGMVAFAPAAQGHPGHPPDTSYASIRVNVGASYCLHWSALVDGAPVNVSPCDLYRANTWDIIYLDDHRYFIRVSGTNKCLTTPYWANYHGVLYECYGYADQQWVNETVRVEPPVRWLVKFRNVAHNQCLAGPNWARGSVLLYDCLPYADQEWWVGRVG